MKVAVFCGRPKPVVAVGENQCNLLRFAEKHRGWHYYNQKCRATKRAITGLLKRKSIEVNKHGQFRFPEQSVTR